MPDPVPQSAASQAKTEVGQDYGSMSMIAGSGVLQAWGALAMGKAQRAIADRNAALSRTQAEQSLQAGGYQEAVRAAEGRIMEARTRASAAAGGTVVGAGSNRMVTTSQEAGSEMDQLMIRTMANRRAFGYSAQAFNEETAGEMAALGGRNQAIGALLSTGSREWMAYEGKGRYGY